MRADPVGDGAHVRREVPGDGGRIEQGEILVVYGTEAAEAAEVVESLGLVSATVLQLSRYSSKGP